MINFCKNSFHSILGIPDSDDRRNPPHRWSRILPQPDRGGLRLLVLDSPSAHPENQPDPGAWGLHEAAPPPAGALGLCTESLGSESCDGGIEIGDAGEETTADRNARRPTRRRKAEVRFPPPLPWMTGRGGRRSRFLKAERRDGRFVLTEMRIDPPPEILRAVRGGGRLRLEIIGEEEEGGGESPEAVEIAGEGERWEMPRVRNEGQRCVEAVGGDGGKPLWWSHRFATTA